MGNSQIIILSLVGFLSLVSFLPDVFADPHGIETADNDLATPGCLETSVGCYTPNTMTVDVGHIVTMTNADSTGIHTFTSGTVDGFSPSPDGIFDSGMLMNPGDSFEYTADTVGEFPYYCTLHTWMQGVLIVQEAAEPEPTCGAGTELVNGICQVIRDEEPKVTITAKTSYSSYSNGDNVRLTGNVNPVIEDAAITILVFSPEGDNVGIIQTSLDDSYGNYTVNFRVGGPLYTSTGEYIIELSYGATKTQISINYLGPVTPPTTPYPIPTYPSPAPYGTDVVIPRGTGVPGCEETRSCYDPYRITIQQYSTVTWYNADSAVHTVTSGLVSDGRIGYEFDSGMLMSGESFEAKFSRDGTFNYFCMVHPWMEGQVIVKRGIVTEPPTYDTTPPKILKPTDIVVDAENKNGANVTYDVLAIDETDQIVQPSCSPYSSSFFSIGTTKVTCNAVDSSGNRAQSISFSITVNPPELAIPDWIKNIASFWCDDKIDDSSFIEGIQYLIDNNIIIVSVTQSGYGSTQEIPNWIKNIACWWSEGLISDKDFVSGIEYLVREGIIRV